MNDETRARAERVRAAFGVTERMRVWCPADNARGAPDRWGAVESAHGDLVLVRFASVKFGNPVRYVPTADVFPDPDDAGNLGIMLGAVRAALGNPTLHARRITVGQTIKWRIDGDPVWYGFLWKRKDASPGDNRDREMIGETESDALCAAMEATR